MMRIGGDHYRAVGRELGEIGEHNAADFGISQRVRLVADDTCSGAVFLIGWSLSRSRPPLEARNAIAAGAT